MTETGRSETETGRVLTPPTPDCKQYQYCPLTDNGAYHGVCLWHEGPERTCTCDGRTAHVEEPRVIGAINPVGFSSGGGFRFTHRYEADCPQGEATLWAMSDGTVRWRRPDDVTAPARTSSAKAGSSTTEEHSDA